MSKIGDRLAKQRLHMYPRKMDLPNGLRDFELDSGALYLRVGDCRIEELHLDETDEKFELGELLAILHDHYDKEYHNVLEHLETGGMSMQQLKRLIRGVMRYDVWAFVITGDYEAWHSSLFIGLYNDEKTRRIFPHVSDGILKSIWPNMDLDSMSFDEFYEEHMGEIAAITSEELEKCRNYNGLTRVLYRIKGRAEDLRLKALDEIIKKRGIELIEFELQNGGSPVHATEVKAC